MRAYVIEKELLAHNIALLQERAGDVPIWAVLKGNGYGIGAVPMARVLHECGVDRFAVTEVREVQALREAGFAENPILMLRQVTDAAEINALLDLNAIFTVGSTDAAVILNGIAAERAAMAEVHLKIDTGMGRYGFLPEQVKQVIQVYEYQKNIVVGGIYTHFNCAFCDKKRTRAQFEAFQKVVQAVQAAGYETGIVHCCNSSAFLHYPEMYCDGVRLGSALLGRLPFPNRIGLKRIGHAEATVEEIRWLPKGHEVGYGAGWIARQPTQVAVLDIGWYHGFSLEKGRDLFRIRDCLREIYHNLKYILRGKSLYVSINGKNCKVIGHVGMVHTAVDVTDIDCKIGDRAVLQVNPLMIRGMKVQYR